MRCFVMPFVVRALAVVAAVTLNSAMVPAAPLDEAACKDLDVRQKQLELQGIKDDLAKGPEQAKATLAPARLDAVKQYIAIKEQVAFRCPSLVVLSVPELAEPEAKHPASEPVKGAEPKSSKSATKKKKRRTIEIEVPAPDKKAAKAD